MMQEWNQLLFAHWPVAADALRPLVPQRLELDRFEGQGWVAVTPFCLTGLRVRGFPALPGLSAFKELNVRTYVLYEGRPGVFFFSLDASSASAVCGARMLYSLPYFFAHMRVQLKDGTVHYRCRRNQRHGTADFEARYWPISQPRIVAGAGTLEQFLVERYCLYSVAGPRLYRADIHHPPWSLQDARAEIPRNSMTAAAGIELPPQPPLLHFSRYIKVLVWWPERLR